MPVKRNDAIATIVYTDAGTRAAWDEFVRQRGSTLKAEITVAMARHIASPPPTPESVLLPPPRRPRKQPADR